MKNIKPHYIISAVVLSGLFFATLSFNNQPLFSNLDQFVLIAEDKIELLDNVQVSSGDLASNQEIRIRQNNIINGNLFTNQIRIDATSTINGNASFNQLEIDLTSKILGSTTTPVSLPIVNLSQITAFQPEEQKIIITQDQTINPGNFDEIQVQPNITLTLNPGTYNINKLELLNNSKLLFSASTTINIQKELVIKEKILISQTINIPSTDFQINVQEDKDIQIGKDSLLSLKLLAPNSQVELGQRITFRGQILAREVRVGEDSILSRQDFFSKESDSTKIVEDQEIKFIVNEILVLFKDEATQADAQQVANLINGRIIGFIPTPKVFKFEVLTLTPQELLNKIQIIKNSNNPLIVEVVQNLVSQ